MSTTKELLETILKRIDELDRRIEQLENKDLLDFDQLEFGKSIKDLLGETFNGNYYDCCRDCSNNPTNGGSGICNCTLPYLQHQQHPMELQKVTTTITTNNTSGEVIIYPNKIRGRDSRNVFVNDL